VVVNPFLEFTGYQIGEKAFGGTIIYVSGSVGSQYGLVAADTDILGGSNGIQWGCSGTNVTTSAGLNEGRTNMFNILATCGTRPILASEADDFVSGGFLDWWMPSIDELYQVYLAKAFVPNLVENTFFRYLSSTQFDSTTVQSMNMVDGIYRLRNKDGVTDPQFVRPVRRFGIWP
jgi:hypothetical protein